MRWPGSQNSDNVKDPFFNFQLTSLAQSYGGGKHGFKWNLRKSKEGLKGEKKVWNSSRQFPDPTMAPQVGGQLFGVHLPIFNFKF